VVACSGGGRPGWRGLGRAARGGPGWPPGSRSSGWPGRAGPPAATAGGRRCGASCWSRCTWTTASPCGWPGRSACQRHPNHHHLVMPSHLPGGEPGSVARLARPPRVVPKMNRSGPMTQIQRPSVPGRPCDPARQVGRGAAVRRGRHRAAGSWPAPDGRTAPPPYRQANPGGPAGNANPCRCSTHPWPRSMPLGSRLRNSWIRSPCCGGHDGGQWNPVFTT
jgi:hypothetical protein